LSAPNVPLSVDNEPFGAANRS